MSAPCDIAAYYWPAYHDEPRWRRFMPAGEGEWQTIRRARAKFPGHWQPRVPLWGCEDEADPRVMERKIDAAAAHGISAFIFDWYWYENAPFLEDALTRGFLAAGNRGALRFFLMWANHDATTLWDFERSHERGVIWPGAVDAAGFEAATDRMIARFFGQPSYYRVNGRPVLSIYELGTLMKGLGGIEGARRALDGLRDRVRAAGFAGLHLQAILWSALPATADDGPGAGPPTQDHTLRTLGFDSLTHYQWAHAVRPRGPYAAWAEAAMAGWEPVRAAFSVPYCPHVSVGWDTNPRYHALQESIVTEPSPALFGACLRRALETARRARPPAPFVTINSWNEWAEGSYLEPDTRFGMGYLDAVCRAASAAARAGRDGA